MNQKINGIQTNYNIAENISCIKTTINKDLMIITLIGDKIKIHGKIKS